MNNEVIKGHLMTLISDCEMQANSLRAGDDICWDVYDIDNWICMAESLRAIAKELNIEVEE